MASTVWLLVEWIDLCDEYSSFGVVNMMDTFFCDASDLRPGKFIIVRAKHKEIPRRANILQTSESKRDVEELKNTLELQSRQYKIDQKICVRSINEPESTFYAQQQTSSHSPSNHTCIVAAQNGNAINSSQPIISNTLLPSRAQKKIRLNFDQGTQTDEVFSCVKLEELEATLKKLYRRFLNSKANTMNSNGSQHNDETLYIEANVGETRINTNNTQYEQQTNLMRAGNFEEVRAGTRKKLYRTCKSKKSQAYNMNSIGSTLTSVSQHNDKVSYTKQNVDNSWKYPNNTQYEQQANLVKTETVEEFGAVALKKLYNIFKLLKSEVNNTNSNGSTSTSVSQHNDEVSYIAQDVDDTRIDTNYQYEQQANLMRAETVKEVRERALNKLNRGYNVLKSPVNNINSNGSTSTSESKLNDEALYIAQDVNDTRTDTNNSQYEQQANLVRTETVDKVKAETRKKLYSTYKFFVNNMNSNGSSSTSVSPQNDETSYIEPNVGDSRIDTNNTPYEQQANLMRAETMKEVRAGTLNKLNRGYNVLKSQVNNINSSGSTSTSESQHNDEALHMAQDVDDTRIDTNNSQYEQVGAETRKKLYSKFKYKKSFVNNMNSNGSSSTSVSPQNVEAPYIDANVGDSWIDTNNTQCEQQANLMRAETIKEVRAGAFNKLNRGYNFLKSQVNHMNSNGLSSMSVSQHNDEAPYIDLNVGNSIDINNTQYEQQANLIRTDTVEKVGAETRKKLYSKFKREKSFVNNMNSNGSSSTSVSQQNDETSYIEPISGDSRTDTNNTQYEQQANSMRAKTAEEVGAVTLKKLYNTSNVLKSQVNNTYSNGSSSTSVSLHNDKTSYIEPNLGDSRIDTNNTQYYQQPNLMRAETVKEVRAGALNKLNHGCNVLKSPVNNINSNGSTSTSESQHNDEALHMAQDVDDTRIDTNNSQYEQVGAETRKKLYSKFKSEKSLVSNMNSNGSSSTSVSPQNVEAPYIDANVGDSWIDTNNTQCEYQANLMRAETMKEVRAGAFNKLNRGYNFLKSQVNHMNSNGLSSMSVSQHNDEAPYIDLNVGNSIDINNTQYEQQANLIRTDTVEKVGAETRKNLYSKFKHEKSFVNNMNSNGSSSTSVSPHNDETSYFEPNVGDFWIDTNISQYEQQANLMRTETIQEVRAGAFNKLNRGYNVMKSQVHNINSNGSTYTSESQVKNKALYIAQGVGDTRIDTNNSQHEQQTNLVRTETVEKVGAETRKKLYSTYKFKKFLVNKMNSNGSSSTSESPLNDEALHMAQDVDDTRIDTNNSQYEQQANLVRTETVDEVGAVTLKQLYNTCNVLKSQVNNTNSNGSSSTSVSLHNNKTSYIEPNLGDSRIDTNNTQYDQQANLMGAETVKEVRAVALNKLNRGYVLKSQVNNINSNGSTSTSESQHNIKAPNIDANVGDSWKDTNNTQYEQKANLMRAETIKEVRARAFNKLNRGYNLLKSQVNNINSNGSTSTSESQHIVKAPYIDANLGDSRIDTNNTQYEQQVNLMGAETIKEVRAETLNKLNCGYNFLKSQVNHMNSNGLSSMSVSQHNDEAPYIDPNVGDSIDINNTQYEQQANLMRAETVEEVRGETLKIVYSSYKILKSQVNNINSNCLTTTSVSQHNDEASYIELNVGDSWIHPNNTQYEQQANLMRAETVKELGAGTLQNFFSTFKFDESQVNTMNSNGSTSTFVSQHNDEASVIAQNADDTWINPNNTQYEQQAYLAKSETVEKAGAETLKKVYCKFNILTSQVNNINSNGLITASVSQHNDKASYIEPNVGGSWIYPNNTQYEQEANLIRAESVAKVGKDGVVEDDNGGEQRINSSTVKAKEKFNMLRVRRLSQLTTKNDENVNDVYMVPIGSGIAKVPARLQLY